MSRATEKAQRYDRIKRDDTFKEIMQEMRDRQVLVFTDTSATIEAIAEAHDRLRFLGEIESMIQARIDDGIIDEKRNQ